MFHNQLEKVVEISNIQRMLSQSLTDKFYRGRKMSIEIEPGGDYINSRGRRVDSFLAVTSHFFLRVGHIVQPFLNTFPFTSLVKNFLGSYFGKLTGL